MTRTLFWFRNDLRVDDHPGLHALAQDDRALFVYCIDPRLRSHTEMGHPRIGPHRARFLLETVEALAQRLHELGASLVTRHADPRVAIPEIAQAWGATRVLVTESPTTDERRDVDAVRTALAEVAIPVQAVPDATLYDDEDVARVCPTTPAVFTKYRHIVEKHLTLAPPVDAPSALPAPGERVPTADPLPSIESWCGRIAPPREHGWQPAGGERAGQQRLSEWVWRDDRLRTYKDTRNGLLDVDDASRLSPWLAAGALSPRRIAATVHAYETQRVANASTYWLVFELLWRDYFHRLARSADQRLFARDGIARRPLPWRADTERFEAWRSGRTGIPLVDAAMRELAQTGFTTNRARQNVASFLAKVLEIDWRWGAMWFESQLVDYDAAANWGNWQYVAGVGTDPRDRVFFVVGQGERYDPEGTFLRTWLPELANVPAPQIHAPWRANAKMLRERYGAAPLHPIIDYDADIARRRSQ